MPRWKRSEARQQKESDDERPATGSPLVRRPAFLHLTHVGQQTRGLDARCTRMNRQRVARRRALALVLCAALTLGVLGVALGWSTLARASIIGQPVHLTSPLVPAMLLLISLARVDLADFHKKAIWRAVICSLVMLGVAIALGVVPLG